MRSVAGLLVLIAIAASAHGLTVTDRPDEVRIASAELTVTVRKTPFALAVGDGSATLLQQAAGSAAGSLTYTRGGAVHRVVDVTGVSAAGPRVSLTCSTSEGPGATVTIEFSDEGTFRIALAPPDPATVDSAGETLVAFAGERFYGLTERIVSDGMLGAASEVIPQAVGGLDRRGEIIRMSVTPTISIYTPFHHSSRGYGLFVDGPMQGSYDLGATIADRVAFSFDFDREAGVFRYWFLHGPGHATILDRYTALSGRPWLPPRWAYRHMRWRDEHAAGATALLDGVAMNADLVEDVTMYEALGLPAPGWYNFDRPWTPGPKGGCPSAGFVRFAFDPARFPNADQMIAALAARGTRTVVFNAPWACGDPADPADNAFDAAANGWYAPGSPDHIDFTNPAAAAWWRGKIGAFVDAMGVSGFKLDRGDEAVPSMASHLYADGRTGLALHNDYPRLYVRAYHDALQARIPDDWVTMSRPGYAGSQAWGLFWGGDITGAESFGTGPGTDKGLRSALISLQRLAFMGFPNWGTDTGGYYQFKQRDVFARWLQFSAFCPVMEIGGGRSIVSPTGGPHAPWAMPTEPAHDDEMIDVYRYYTWLHHELVPYAWGEGVRASRSGHPIATPLVFEFPDDPAVADLFDEYLYGPWLLVAPVWRDGERTRPVYLPTGGWTSWWDDATAIAGPAMLASVGAPLGRIPLYVRLGAIIPLEVVNDATGHGTAASAGRLTLDVFPHHSSSHQLREPGVTLELTSTKDGAYGDVGTITLTTAPTTRDWLVRVKSNFRPAGVLRDGVPLAEHPTQEALDAAADGWLYLAAERRVLVKHATTGSAATVTLVPPCTVRTEGQRRWTKPVLVASRIGDVRQENDRLVLRGRFALAGGRFDVDPVANGARVEMRSASHDAFLSAVLPPGAAARRTSGWRRARSGRRFVFHSRGAAGAGSVRTMVIAERRNGTVEVLVVARRSRFALAPGHLPLEASVTLGGLDASADGGCGELSFTEPGRGCRMRGKRIICR
jgi:alpha-D-xyloside xylohydrolase